MTVLCIAAHPDDETLGCGGTLSRLAQEGKKIHILILGQGAMARFGKGDNSHQDMIQTLRNQSRQAAAILGAADICFHDLPDNRFDTLPLLDIVKLIEDHIDKVKPEIIFTHHPADLNIDHEITSRAVVTATRPTGNYCVKEVFAFEIPSSTQWSFGCTKQGEFSPDLFIDIKATLQTKLAAIKQYTNECKAFPHPRSEESLTALAKFRGSSAGLEACEAFSVIRMIR